MRRIWVYVALVGMLAIALSAGLNPWRAAIAGAFLPADLAADVAAAHLFIRGTSPYGPVIRATHMEMTGLPLSSTLPYFPHPPFSLIVGLPMGFMAFRTAALVWFAVTVALLFALAILLSEAGATDRGGTGGAISMWFLLLAWPPVLYNLEKGQWSILLAVLLALAWRAVTAGDLRTGARWAALAAAVKVFPVVLGAYFLLRSLRSALWFGATGLILLCIPLLWIGAGAFPAFVRESRMNLPYWESFPLVMFSIHGTITRALVGGQWAQPFVSVPVGARVIEGVLMAALVALAVQTTLAAKGRRLDQSTSMLTWLVLLPLLNPLSLGHNGVLLALPIVVLGRKLMREGGSWQRWGWTLAVMLVSVPNQTVWYFAAPPSGPWPGLLVAALPMWGTLLLFLTAISVVRGTPSVAEASPASAKLVASPAISISSSAVTGRRDLTLFGMIHA